MRAPEVDGPVRPDRGPVQLARLPDVAREPRRLPAGRARRCSLPAGASPSTSSPRATTSSPRRSAPCPPLRVDADHPAPDHGVTRFLRSYTDAYDAASQTLRSTNRYEIFYEDGRVEHRIADLDWHIYFPEELELLLESAGLSVVERYGDYDRSPWNAASRRYLWLAARHDTAREG